MDIYHIFQTSMAATPTWPTNADSETTTLVTRRIFSAVLNLNKFSSGVQQFTHNCSAMHSPGLPHRRHE